MSLTLALRTALSGLSASQSALQVTSNNITNVNTEGFTRKKISLETRILAGQGAGVQVAAIDRVVDDFLLGQIRDEQSVLGNFTVREQFLSEIEALFGTPDNDRSISRAIDNLKNALEALSVTPETEANRFNAVNEARKLALQINELSDTVQRLRLKADKEITTATQTINSQVKIIADLNVRIGRAAGLNQPFGDLLDQRDAALEKLTKEMDVKILFDSNDQVSILTNTGRNILTVSIQDELSHTSAAQMDASLNYLEPGDADYPGSITGIFLGTPDTTAGSNDITNEIKSGRLKALIDLRDELLPNLQAELDRLSQDLMLKINASHNEGTAFPPPSKLTGTHSFVSGDVLSASGTVRIAVLNQSDGTVVESADISLGSITTVGALVTAINSALTNATASLDSDGKLVISANNSGQGIAINESTSSVTVVGSTTRKFSHYFGLNDFFVADVTTSDYNGFASAQQTSSTTALGLSGTLTFEGAFGSTTVTYSSTDTLDGIASSINSNTTLSAQNIKASVINDGTGRRLLIRDSDKNNFLITDSGSLLSTLNVVDDNTGISKVLEVRSDIVATPSLMARGQLNSATTLSAGDDGITVGDGTTANALAGIFDTDISFTSAGGISATTTTLSRYAAQILSVHATLTFEAKSQLEFNQQFIENLQFRSAAVSGVNVDEELSNLVIFEQAFNASARIVSTASDMLRELLDAVR